MKLRKNIQTQTKSQEIKKTVTETVKEPVKVEQKTSQPSQENKNIISVFAQMSKGNVRFEVPEYGFMMKRNEDSYEELIRFNFQSLDKNNKQTGFGSYYLAADRMLFLIHSLTTGLFDEKEAISRAGQKQFPDPIFEDEKPGQGDEYKYFAILPGMKEGKILVRYICRNLKTKKQIANIQIPFDKEVFIGKMLQIQMQMMKV